MNLIKLIENLRSFSEKKKYKDLSIRERFSFKNDVMQEISSKQYDIIKNWLDNAGEDKLSFNKLLGGKKRIVIPFGGKSEQQETMEKISTFLELNGWTMNLADGTASREIEREIPSGPRKGEKTKKIEKQRIGKLIDLIDEKSKLAYSLTKAEEGSAEKQEVVKKFKEFNSDRFLKTFPNANEEQSLKIWSDNFMDSFSNKKGSWGKFWNEKSEYYRNNPDALAMDGDGEYSIIISRHPIDVLRMSDFENIHSCHSEGGSYFRCAVAEAKGHGPIAYLVKKKDVQNVDLEKEEIFADKSRGIDGIKPIARVRLRKFTDENGRWELAVPEERVYGDRMPGFREAVVKWARKNQDFVTPEQVKKTAESDKLVRWGGSYADSRDGALINQFFQKDLVDKWVKAEIRSDEDSAQDIFENYEERCSEIFEQYSRDLQHYLVNFEVQMEGNYVFVDYYVKFVFDLSKILNNASDKNINYNLSKVEDILEKSMIKEKFILDDQDLRWDVFNGKFVVKIEDEDLGLEKTPDGLEQLFRHLVDLEAAHDSVLMSFENEFNEVYGGTSVGTDPASISEFNKNLKNSKIFFKDGSFIFSMNVPISSSYKDSKVPRSVLSNFAKRKISNELSKQILNPEFRKQAWLKGSQNDPKMIDDKVNMSFLDPEVSISIYRKFKISNEQNLKPLLQYFLDIDKAYTNIAKISIEIFNLVLKELMDEFSNTEEAIDEKQEVATSDINNSKIFENWRNWARWQK